MNLPLSPGKLAQISSHCGSTVSAVEVGRFLSDTRYDINGCAAALSTTPATFQQAIDLPEPVPAPMVSSTVRY